MSSPANVNAHLEPAVSRFANVLAAKSSAVNVGMLQHQRLPVKPLDHAAARANAASYEGITKNVHTWAVLPSLTNFPCGHC